MRYAQLRAFDAVARHRGFSRAARSLGLTQPAVTMQVRLLEKACGQALFDRAGRVVELTAAGKALLDLTRSLFAAEEEVEEFVGSAHATERGTLRLAADAPHVALLLVSAFRRRHPGIEVAVSLGSQRVTLEDVLAYHADAAVLGNAPTDPRLWSMPITRQDMMVLVPRAHPLARRKMVALADLAGEPIVRREAGSNTQRLADEALRRAGIAVAGALEAGSREAVREAVRLGLGLGFVLEREARPEAGTVARPIAELRGCNVDALICLNSQRKHRIVRAFLDVAAGLKL
jgi:aminoethylphosphonate catabolism LysR family transcriptional regulator